MRVRVLTGFALGSGVNVDIGQELDLEEWNARRLAGLGYVALTAAPAPPAASSHAATMAAPEIIETREPEPENREPRMRREG